MKSEKKLEGQFCILSTKKKKKMIIKNEHLLQNV